MKVIDNSHGPVCVDGGILQVFPDTGQVGQDLFSAPTMTSGQQSHTQAFQPATDVGQRPQAHEFVPLVFRPAIGGPFVVSDCHVCKASCGQAIGMVSRSTKRSPELFTGGKKKRRPFIDGLAWVKRAVVGPKWKDAILKFKPSARCKVSG